MVAQSAQPPVTIKQPRNTMYDNMVFPEYEFREFPQAIPVVGGKIMPTPYDERHKPYPVVIVDSQEELDALSGPEVTLVPISEDVRNSAMRVESDTDIKAALILQGEQIGAKIDKRWTAERMEEAIKDHMDGRSEVV